MLPFKFGTSGDFEVDAFVIDNVSIEPIKSEQNQGEYDSIEVECITDIEAAELEDFAGEIHFRERMTRIVGSKVNRFINSYYREVDRYIVSQLFNGSDFITRYDMMIFDMNGNAVAGAYIANANLRIFDEKAINRINDGINKEEEISDKFLRQAACFLENGYYDMALMNAAIALESLIKGYVHSKGVSDQDLSKVVKKYVIRYFHFGLMLSIGKSLKNEEPKLYNSVLEIHSMRNHIAHGKSIYSYNDFKGMNEDELFDIIEYYIDEIEEVFDWIRDNQ